jgi:hypothetical protein
MTTRTRIMPFLEVETDEVEAVGSLSHIRIVTLQIATKPCLKAVDRVCIHNDLR